MSMRTALLAVLLVACAPTGASAQSGGGQGFFAPLLSLFGGHQRAAPQPAWRRNDVDAYPEITVRPPATRQPTRRAVVDDEPGEEALGPRAFCVRTCDGFYFPIGPSAGGSTAQAQQAMCARFCPASEVALYSVWSGGEVADAVGPGRRRYSELPTAFRFRTELSPSCTCNGRVGGGLASVAPADDFTLRRGDVVAGAEGPLVFAGGGRLPFRDAQFNPVRNNQLSREMMRRFKVGSAAHRNQSDSPVEATVEAERADRPIRVVPLGMVRMAETN